MDERADKKASQKKGPNKTLLSRLARANRFKQLFSVSFKQSARRHLQRFVPLDAYDRCNWRAKAPYADAEEVSSYPARVDVRIGIIKEVTHLHGCYVGACRELGVPYKLLDISGPDWIDVIENSGCHAFLVRPSVNTTVWKQMYDERFKVMVEELGKIIFPSYNELWMYESKRRMHYWLKANRVPHAKTWVFYDRREALKFAKEAELPIVYKADHGAASYGIKIFRNRSRLLRFVNRCFSKGSIIKGGDIRDKQWGTVLFEEYLPDIAEWRIIRIGKSYFGYQKLKKGDFHSGSHSFRYSEPPAKLLDFAKEITVKRNFRSIALDIFVTTRGEYRVNELQTFFGLHVSEGLPMADGKPGRMLYDAETNSWIIEEGNFCRNNLCNLRVETLLEILGVHIPLKHT